MSRFAELKSALAKGADESNHEIPDPADEPEEDETNPKSKRKEEPDMTETTTTDQAALDAAHAAGFKAANERMNTVFASEHYAGHEAAAHKLLGKDMSAEDIIDVLADMPKIELTAALSEEEQRKAAEDAGRAEMKAAINGGQNAAIEPNGGGAVSADDPAAAAAIWDGAIRANHPGVDIK